MPKEGDWLFTRKVTNENLIKQKVLVDFLD